jgi:hypothetical protein
MTTTHILALLLISAVMCCLGQLGCTLYWRDRCRTAEAAAKPRRRRPDPQPVTTPAGPLLVADDDETVLLRRPRSTVTVLPLDRAARQQLLTDGWPDPPSIAPAHLRCA